MVQEKVASGLYINQSEVVRESLRLLSQQDRAREAQIEYWRSALSEGVAQADRGELLDGESVFEELREEMEID